MRPLASIRTSKGCHFRCQFCALWKLTGGHYFTRQPERIVEELGAIEEKYVFFADDESLLDTERMGVLAELIQRAGIDKRFFLYGRSDTIARHPELLAQWKKAGLERVFVGLECIRDADLKLIRKGSTVENNLSALRILKELDIEVHPPEPIDGRKYLTRGWIRAEGKVTAAGEGVFVRPATAAGWALPHLKAEQAQELRRRDAERKG